MPVSRKVLGIALVGLILATCVAGQGPTITQDEELTDEQKEYYENVFTQYDVDHDGFITMEENLEQDRAIAEEAGKPFDEVYFSQRLRTTMSLCLCLSSAALLACTCSGPAALPRSTCSALCR
jgi:hypothetical protein